MRIALAQINTTVGDIQANIKKINYYYQKAKKEKADIVIFPELTITGYPPLDLLENSDFIDKNIQALKSFSKKVSGTACIIGYVDINPQVKGKKIKNAAAFIHNQKITNIYKSLLPTYDIFDEERYFESSNENQLLIYNSEKIGLTICEDVWADTKLLPDRFLYKFNPLKKLLFLGAKTIINISASPFEKGKIKQKIEILSEIARQNKIKIIYVNSVGANDELIFDGRSFILNEKGEIILKLKEFEEDFQIFEDKSNNLENITYSESTEEIKKAIILGIKDYFFKQGFSKALLGLSGGIDSAVVAALSKEALGSENVTAILMPSEYTSKESIYYSLKLAKNLGIKTKTLPIAKIYKEYLNTLSLKTSKIDTTLQNIQARIRGNILMALSNKNGALVLTTGNKSEISMGYSTLYGDTAGAIAPLGDVLKTDVYNLARLINLKKEIIPDFIIKRPPTAELKPNQKDQDDLPPYEVLDKIIEMYIENNIRIKEIERKLKRKDVISIIKRIENNEYKRKQIPICFKISSKSFGSARKMPINKKIDFLK